MNYTIFGRDFTATLITNSNAFIVDVISTVSLAGIHRLHIFCHIYQHVLQQLICYKCYILAVPVISELNVCVEYDLIATLLVWVG